VDHVRLLGRPTGSSNDPAAPSGIGPSVLGAIRFFVMSTSLVHDAQPVRVYPKSSRENDRSLPTTREDFG
jgi:hypothetical protein